MSYRKITGRNVNYYVMEPEAIFGATATIIEKEGKALLVDTQFSQDDAENIIRVAKENEIEIETIYISYSDPDYYFAANKILEAFPNAKLIATASNIERIQSTYEDKLVVWKDILKDKAPDKIIIPNEVRDLIKLDNEEFIIFGNDEKKQTLYNKLDELILGGILISTDSHLFMADTKTVESQKQWIDDLNELISINPKTVIPGHFSKENEFSFENIKFTKEYIEKFMEVEKESKASNETIEKMKNIYPDLPDGSLEMSAKVVTGEMPWD
ncbi:MBL fold metallo-hydrolase [Peptostreptococcus faecalis]|uniref:MBL fold metallo-hydrolase n=1 Tax=Peptostreptococcus faecalis TaxID=2045015 RepID=UPI000C79F925|nr:MBL fold metallo-hydrolase [Peptostreptococcus faecalis]